MSFFLLYVQFVRLVITLLDIYGWIIIAYCIVSMMVGFGIGNVRNNRFFLTLLEFLSRLVEPLLRPLRNLLPNTGMLDLSPLVLLLLVQIAIPYVLRESIRLLYVAQ